MSEARSTVVPVPLLTSVVRAGHPFFVGPGGQTRRSRNVWVDERRQVRRRPGLMRICDWPFEQPITGLFEYQYKSRSSKPLRQLLAFVDGGFNSSSGAKAQWTTVGPGPVSGAPPAGASGPDSGRLLFYDLFEVYTTTSFHPGEVVDLYIGGTGSSGGIVMGGGGFPVPAELEVDNLDYGGADGSVLVRTYWGNYTLNALMGALAAVSVRVQGRTSGANVRFGDPAGPAGSRPYRVHPARTVLWNSTGSTHVTQAWRPGAVPSFAQYGPLVFATDSSALYPMRVWSGGHVGARSMVASPRGAIVSVHQGRALMANLENDSARLWLSRAGDPYDWKVSNDPFGPMVFGLEQDDRANITGVAPSYYGDLYVWKQRSIHRVQGDLINGGDFRRTTVSRSIGCAAQGSIVHVGNDIFWASDRGVHSLLATDKYGEVESAYLSFPIADVFESLNQSSLSRMQAVFEPRLGLYMLGVPDSGSEFMSLLLAYSIASQRWMVWDIGTFSSIAIGPGIGSSPASVYVGLVDEWEQKDDNGVSNRTFPRAGHLAVLDFQSQVDYDYEVGGSGASAIDVVLEPGDVFAQEDPNLRFPKKSANRAQVYLSPSGSSPSNMIYSWDNGDEMTAELDHNPRNVGTYGDGLKMDDPVGATLGSDGDTLVSSVPVYGRGHSMRFRLEDSNLTRLPYLHVDLEVEVHDKEYTQR